MMILPGSAFIASGGDPYWANVVLLYHATDLYDVQLREWDTTYASIISGGRITPRDYPNGITDRIFLTDLDFACPGDYTLEMEVEFLDFPSAGVQLGQSVFWGGVSSNGPGVWLNCQDSTNTLHWCSGSDLAVARDTGVTIAEDVKYHLAIARHGNTTRIFLAGMLIDTDSHVGAIGIAIENGYLAFGGTQMSGLEYFKIRLDEIRLTKGFARYTADFTPPATPFPNN